MTVSIICTSYNYGHYLSDTIESVLSQTCPDWELIMVDDGSSDNSCQIISDYTLKDNRIKLFVHPGNKNKGLIETLKLGVNAASDKWIVFLESDDMLKPDYIAQKIHTTSLHPEADLIFSGLEIMGSEPIVSNYAKIFKNRDDKIKENFNILYMLEENVIPTFSCVMIKKSVFEGLNFNSPMGQNLDWWLWAQVLANNNVVYLDKNLSIWRKHEGSYISTVKEKMMSDFKRGIFNFIFLSKNKLIGQILFNIFMFFDLKKSKKLFATLSKKIRLATIAILCKFNKIKANFTYINN